MRSSLRNLRFSIDVTREAISCYIIDSISRGHGSRLSIDKLREFDALLKKIDELSTTVLIPDTPEDKIEKVV